MGQVSNLVGHPTAVRVNTVINMGHDKVETMQVSGPHEKIQKRNGIGSPGNRDQRLSGWQSEAGEMAPKTL